MNTPSISPSKAISDLPTSSTPSRARSSHHEPSIAILWDMENCPVPNDVRPEDVGGNMRMALKLHPIITGTITTFCAYGDFNSFTKRLREGCHRTGVKLIDVPNGRKDAADKAILIDMFLFALDNPPPSTIWLISGDVDFAQALHVLGQRGYAIILSIPSGVGVSSALTNAGMFIWDWNSVARGEDCLLSNLSSSLPSDDSDQLKMQLISLLEINGGCIPLARIPAEFQKTYGRPLGIGSSKLLSLLKKMGDAVSIDFRGNKKLVYLRNFKVVSSSVCDLNKGKKKTREKEEKCNIEKFRLELEEILVSYSCGISLGCFEEIYEMRYKKALEYKKLGVIKIEDLFEKVRDIAVLCEEPISKQKIIRAVGR